MFYHTAIPSWEEQKQALLSINLSSNDEDEQLEYILTTNWWRNWCDYVNIEFKPLALYLENPELKEAVGIINDNLSDVGNEESKNKFSRGKLHVMQYSIPLFYY